MDAKKEWFASWFDSPYYHTLYKNRDHSEAQKFVEKLITHLQAPPQSEVLDLACGKGRHSLVLAEHGLQVTGADLSPNSIEAAKKLERDNLHFVVHDMRNPIGNEAFHYIFNLFTSFGYFSRFVDNLKTINAIHAALKKDGILVIDFMNSIKVINNLVPKESKSIDGIDFSIERKVAKSIITKSIFVSDKGEHKHFEEKVQALVLEDFQAYFYNKFKIKGLFGDYQLNPFDENNSDRLILVCQRTC